MRSFDQRVAVRSAITAEDLVPVAHLPILANQRIRFGSFASVRPDHGDFRSTPVNGHSQDRRACLKGAKSGHPLPGAEMLAIERESEDNPHGFNQSGGLGWTLIGVERQPNNGPLSRRRRHGPEVEARGVERVNPCRH